MDFRDLLSSGGLNTLTFNDPYAKIVCTSSAISQLGPTLYIDLDTMFSAYASAYAIRSDPAIQADIFLPSKGRFMQVFNSAIDKASTRKYSLIVFDSLNSFYNMYEKANKGKLGRLNHLLCILVMLLTKYASDLDVPVLVTSMLRYRKDRGWVQSPASRRLIQYSSVSWLNAQRSREENGAGTASVVVTVEKHPSIATGQKIICSGVSITLRPPESTLS